MPRLFCYVTFVILGLALPEQAYGYVGPGAGLSALGTFVAMVGAFLLLIVGFVWYPVKRLLRSRKTVKVKESNSKKTADQT